MGDFSVKQLQTILGPLINYVLEENHIVSLVSKMLWYKQTAILLLSYKDTDNKFVQDSGEAASVERGVDKIKYHIKYDETTTDYDIALIKLDAPGEFFQLTRKYNTTQR